MMSLFKRGVAGLLLVGGFAVSYLPAPPQALSVSEGVYTDEQATRGQTVYTAKCASCHAPNLTGRSGPPLAGDDFLANWDTQPLLELANKIRRTMPRDDSPRLTDKETADVLAYMLQVGKFPNGRTELSMDDAMLKRVSFPARTAARPAASSSTQPSLAAVGNVAQVMRGILFPSANIIFTVQTIDPAVKKEPKEDAQSLTLDWLVWGGNVYKGWEIVDYAAVSVGESAALMLTPGRRCENGQLAPVNDPDWIKFTKELADAGKAGLKASQTRNQETVSEFTNQLNDSCQHCHGVFRGRTHCVKR